MSTLMADSVGDESLMEVLAQEERAVAVPALAGARPFAAAVYVRNSGGASLSQRKRAKCLRCLHEGAPIGSRLTHLVTPEAD